jgi:glycosyltransferase involved in cell wall biosynthesis
MDGSAANIRSTMVSIIMNCYNCSRYLKEAIDSVYVQTYGDWEIIFWDNVSTDNSAEIAKSYNSKLLYFRGDTNVPLGNARNLAIEKANGRYIAFLDCDDIWLPSKLEKQVSLFEANPDVKLVFSDSNVVNSKRERMYNSFSVQQPFRGHVFNDLLLSYNFIPLVTAVIERSVLEDVGMFDNRYKIAEEYDFFLRIAHEYPLDYVDETLAEYRVHDSNWSHKQDICIREELEIINKWVNQDFSIKHDIGHKVMIRKMKRHAALYLFYAVKYLHLPKSFAKFY